VRYPEDALLNCKFRLFFCQLCVISRAARSYEVIVTEFDLSSWEVGEDLQLLRNCFRKEFDAKVTRYRLDRGMNSMMKSITKKHSGMLKAMSKTGSLH